MEQRRNGVYVPGKRHLASVQTRPPATLPLSLSTHLLQLSIEMRNHRGGGRGSQIRVTRHIEKGGWYCPVYFVGFGSGACVNRKAPKVAISAVGWPLVATVRKGPM
jgi:hypothetical protein